MKFTTTALVSALATLAAAETFNFFPTSDLTCQASNGTVSFTVKEIKDAARDSKDGTPKETSARNIATAARCSYSLPYFETTIVGAQGMASMTFIYDSSADNYTMCGLFADDVNGDGYPDSCA